MRNRHWRWLAIGLVVINIAYWGWQGWRWKQMVDARFNQIETAVIKMHPELAQRPPPQSPAPPQSPSNE